MPKHAQTRLSRRPLAALAALVTGAALLTAAATSSGTSAAVTIPTPDHTVIVVMENHSYSEVIGAPYIASLAKAGANMTDSHGVRHPSEPNYLALWSGSTQGLTDDSCPHTFSGPSLGQQLLSAGKSTAIYSENLPAAGSLVCSASGGYARKHNPLADFTATSGAATNKPYTAWPAADFTKLPDVAMVVPNLCDDMHDCSVPTGDNWLKAHIDPYVQWAKTHNSLLILTFDEDDFTTANRIPTILVGPMVKPGNYGETINHYNVLHTIEAAHGLPQLGVAAAPITDIWAGSAPATSGTPTTAPPTSSSAASTSSAPTSSAITSPAPTSSSTGPWPMTPLRGAFYYPWFGQPGAWSQNGITPYTRYHPTAGFYSSTDPALIAYETAGMRYAGLDFAISSWWGQGSREDQAVPAEMAAANGLKFTLYYEAEGNGPDPSVSQIQSDLGYIASRYATNPAYLTKAGRPVLFVYGDAGDNCATATRWAQANAGRFYLVLKVVPGYRTCAQQPDSWHQYGPAVATDSQAGYSYSVSPGFWKADESSPRLTRDPARWAANLQAMVASRAPWQLITTWNEWGEGTSVESASEWAGPGPFGTYVEAMRDVLAP